MSLPISFEIAGGKIPPVRSISVLGVSVRIQDSHNGRRRTFGYRSASVVPWSGNTPKETSSTPGGGDEAGFVWLCENCNRTPFAWRVRWSDDIFIIELVSEPIIHYKAYVCILLHVGVTKKKEEKPR